MALTRNQVRRVDQLAIDELGMPGIVLMENAAINATACVVDLLDDRFNLRPDAARVAVVCGSGNNGGDGYAIARHLHNWGAAVTIYAAKPIVKLQGDAATNASICQRMGLAVREEPDDAQSAHVMIDALLGTGFHGRVREPLVRWIEWINGCAGPATVSVDLPSGLDCDTGEPGGSAVEADLTVTFVDRKVGFDEPAAEPYLGRVVLADIGVPVSLVDRVRSE